MGSSEDALALKLTAVVVPNWPNVQGTDISVLDMVECAKRGTPEQQQAGKQAREVMAQIMELDEDAPVRLLLEGFCRPVERVNATRRMELEEGKVAPTWQGRQLPNELVLRTLHFLLPDDGWPRDIEVATLGCVRAVSKSIKHLAETRFPNTLHRYVARIVRKLLHGQASPVHVSRLAHASAPLFKRCKKLRIWVAGDEVETLNNLLEVFEAMETLVVYVTSEEASFGGVNLTVCRSLRCIQFRGIDASAECMEADDEDDSDDRRNLGDTLVNRPVDNKALNFYRGRRTTLRSGLVRLVLGYTPFNAEELYISLASMDKPSQITFGHGPIAADYVVALGLSRGTGPSRLDFEEGLDEDAVALLALQCKVDLKALTLGWGCDTINPAVFALKTNKSLVRLNPGSLLSADLDLDLNKRLRHLDLNCSLRSVQGGISAALRSLGTQLAANTTLEVLDLQYNRITDKAAIALRLSEIKGLKKLSFAQNQISDAGLRAALDGNKTLELVNVKCNRGVTQGCAEELSGMDRRVIVRESDRTWENEVKDANWE